MTDLRKAAQQALDAWDSPTGMKRLCVAMDAFRAVLEQQQAEPVAWTLTETLNKRETTTSGYLWFSNPQNCAWTPLYTTPPQQQAEPVAWTTMPEAADWCFVSGSKDPTGKLEGKWFPLYTAPPQRQWVGLTDEDVRQCSRDVVAGGSENSVDRFAYAIEAKLKEKNV